MKKRRGTSDRELQEEEELKRRRKIGSGTSICDNLVYEILLRLPVESLIRFRSVCKSWSSVLTDRSFLIAHRDRSTPSLMLIRRFRPLPSVRFDLYLLPSPPPSSSSSQPSSSAAGLELELEAAAVKAALTRYRGDTWLTMQASCDGLLCFKDDFLGTYYLHNPLTAEWSQFPSGGFRKSSIACGLYFHPPTQEYRLLHYYKEDTVVPRFSYEILAAGASEPRPFFYGPVSSSSSSSSNCSSLFADPHPTAALAAHVQRGPPSSAYASPVLLHGSLHWLPDPLHPQPLQLPSLIMVFDIVTHKFSEIPVPQHDVVGRYNALAELEGRLCATSWESEYTTLNLWILEDYAEKVWVSKYRIKIQAAVSRLLGFPPRFSLLVSDKRGEIWLAWEKVLLVCSVKGDRPALPLIFRDCYVEKDLYKKSLVPHQFFKMGQGGCPPPTFFREDLKPDYLRQFRYL